MAAVEQAEFSAELTLAHEAATTALAGVIKPVLGAGDVLLLAGPVGAGKSFFARALISAMLADHGLVEDIPSPTFTLVQTYQAGDLEIWHSDLYRLTSVDEVAELGLLDAFATALCLVEWPDRLGEELPADALTLAFALGETPGERQVVISSPNRRWQPLIDRLKERSA